MSNSWEISPFVGIPPFSNQLWVGMETMHFHIANTNFFRTTSIRIQGVPMNNLSLMKNCPGGGGGVQGNLNWMRGYIVCTAYTHWSCKRTIGCYNELVVAFFSTGGGVKGKKIYTCWLYNLFINLHLFYLWWHLAHRPQITLQFMALPSNWWYNSWFGLQIQHSSGVLPWQVFFLV